MFETTCSHFNFLIFKLASLPTDIEPFFLSALEEVAPDFEFFIKRDDETSASMTGNLRKNVRLQPIEEGDFHEFLSRIGCNQI